MAFVLKGEVEIDGRKATTGLRGVQKEATKTADTFKQSNASAQKLGKTLVSLGLNASKAGTSLGMLARLGTGGIFGYAALGAINKFGETVKQASTDYYSAQKDLADAFETSFKSTSVDQARAGLEKTQDTIESLRGKITQLGATKGILKALEKFTGLDLGVKNTEDTLKDAENNLKIQEQTVLARIKEKNIIEGTSDSLKKLEKVSALNKSDIKMLELQGLTRDANVQIALEELRTLDSSNKALEEQLESLNNITGVKKNQEAIDKTADMLLDNRIKKSQLEYNLIKAQQDQQAKNSKQAQEAGGGILGASGAGRQALATARKQREQQLKTENFKVAEKIAPTQREREKLAAQQVAGEMPSLGERIQGGLTGVDPSQLAREAAASKFERDRAFTKGGATLSGKLGEEQSSLGNETLQAIKKLVELMQSGTVVK